MSDCDQGYAAIRSASRCRYCGWVLRAMPQVKSAIRLRACYAMPGTGIAYGRAVGLRDVRY
eukprot:525421-Rhodomonas_salina.3